MISLIVFLGIALLWVTGAIIAMCGGDPSPRKLNKWFRKASHHLKEQATGIYRGYYNAGNDFEEWDYVCLIKWRTMSYRDKIIGYRKAIKSQSLSQVTPYRRDNFNSYGSE